MRKAVPPESQGARQLRKSLRLTFRAGQGKVHLVSFERLDMICPPAVGERPEAGKHAGFWIEVRDKKKKVLFHRLLHSPLGDSVEVHSPDGTIRREFGAVDENIFEALVPDEPGASSIVLIGESLHASTTRNKREGGSRELARFDVPIGTRGGSQ